MYRFMIMIRYYFKVNDFEICKLEIISPPSELTKIIKFCMRFVTY